MNRIIQLADKHIGEPYILGALVPKNDPDYRGPWDCAEFATWLVYQESQKLYGCANNDGNPATADAYTGFWKRDADKLGKIVPVEVAARASGAFVLRYSGSGIIGHIAPTDGYGGTREAHSRRDGVIKSVVAGRRWDTGIMPSWIHYDFNPKEVDVTPPQEIIYRWTTPLMKGDVIREIQKRLNITADGVYGSKTFHAVRNYQNLIGLVPDGEAGPKTLKALAIR